MTNDKPIPAAAVSRHAMADVINRARYRSPEGGLPERGVDEEDRNGRDYAYRIADAVISALPHLAAPAGDAISAQDPMLLLDSLLHFGRSQDGAVERDLRSAILAISADRDAMAKRLRVAMDAFKRIDTNRERDLIRGIAREAIATLAQATAAETNS